MQIDVAGIEKDCEELWSLITKLRELAITAKGSAVFKLTAEQKKLLKEQFLNITKSIQEKVKETTSRIR